MYTIISYITAIYRESIKLSVSVDCCDTVTVPKSSVFNWNLAKSRPSITSWSVFEESWHYNDVVMSAMASQITSLTIVYSTVYSGTDERKHQSSASLAFVRGIHRWPVNSPHKGPVTRKMFPFDDVIMKFFTDRDSISALLCAKFLNDLTTDKLFMGKLVFVRFEWMMMRFEGIFYISTATY